jgi:hypothetical protein
MLQMHDGYTDMSLEEAAINMKKLMNDERIENSRASAKVFQKAAELGKSVNPPISIVFNEAAKQLYDASIASAGVDDDCA